MNPGFTTRDGWRYGLLGLPLAFVALPLYVVLPNYYAREFGVPLATLGWLLLGARLFDAVTDPLLGRWSDRLFARSAGAVLGLGGAAALLLAAGFAGLFFPPTREGSGLLAWATAMLLLTYAAYSALSVSHQSWGALLGGDEAQRGRVVAWREGLGLVGVVLASILPATLGLPTTTAVFFALLGAGWWAWRHAPRPGSPAAAPNQELGARAMFQPFAQSAFRRLLAVFMLNGIASAIPATLVLFFVQDRLQVAERMQPAFLGVYFVSAAASIPLWLRLVPRLGLARTWLGGMLLAMAVFIWAMQLGAGQANAFLWVCALSGAALGTDLALPAALLAGLIAESRRTGRASGDAAAGVTFGWWNFATKLNLALAAGLALPLLGMFGYSPGSRDPMALQALSVAYCLLPCALKAGAAACLYLLIIRPARARTPPSPSELPP